MKKILERDHAVLRKMAIEVPEKDILSPKIQHIIHDMKEALDSQDDGVAIAAPQIGYSLRIFVVSHKVASIIKKAKDKKEKKMREAEMKKNGTAQSLENEEYAREEATEEKLASEDTVFINPIITKISKEKKMMEEGCLSVRYLYGEVNRAQKVTVSAFDEQGNKIVSGASGLLAQIFQHEIDHLNGILFIDKAKYLEEIPPSKHSRTNN